jgi:hypothetical protein
VVQRIFSLSTEGLTDLAMSPATREFRPNGRAPNNHCDRQDDSGKKRKMAPIKSKLPRICNINRGNSGRAKIF